MGGKSAHEFVVLVDTESGESLIFTCSNCDYAVHADQAGAFLVFAEDVRGEGHHRGVRAVFAGFPGAQALEGI